VGFFGFNIVGFFGFNHGFLWHVSIWWKQYWDRAQEARFLQLFSSLCLIALLPNSRAPILPAFNPLALNPALDSLALDLLVLDLVALDSLALDPLALVCI